MYSPSPIQNLALPKKVDLHSIFGKESLKTKLVIQDETWGNILEIPIPTYFSIRPEISLFVIKLCYQ